MATSTAGKHFAFKFRSFLQFKGNFTGLRSVSQQPKRAQSCAATQCGLLENNYGNIHRKSPESWHLRKLGSSFINQNSYTRGYVTAHTNQSCWKCNKNVHPQNEQFFCECGVIQPPTDDRNYFEVMGIETKFDLDTADLTKRFRALQRQLHPDKFTQKTEVEKDYSALQSSMVNKAYSTLVKPLQRGYYMLELCGDVFEEGETNVDPIFLMEIMEINEALTSAESIEVVERIGNENKVILDGLVSQLSEAFDAKNCAEAKEIIRRLKYYANIDETVKLLKSEEMEKM